MTGQLRLVSIAIALFSFGVSSYHFWRASGAPLVTHVRMLAGRALGFPLILGPSGRTRSI